MHGLGAADCWEGWDERRIFGVCMYLLGGDFLGNGGIKLHHCCSVFSVLVEGFDEKNDFLQKFLKGFVFVDIFSIFFIYSDEALNKWKKVVFRFFFQS